MTDQNPTGAEQVDEYVEAAVQRLLTEDAGIAEQGLTVVRRKKTLFVYGEVESPQRRDHILQLLAEKFPDVPLSVDIGITRAQEPTEVEELP
jgi:hypothetical protein